ncbi:putative peptide maturation dehydrogenase [Stenotrophomonas maltophilia]|uniref:putative peptide maturation dehydrogenase n=1 Tax=Stenotrophomonas maltophilia TaxID=40324 RepID=UPI0009A17E72|nr:putative peptide maturation dehydrogenase [Stenotrophomonas maltophilia]
MRFRRCSILFLEPRASLSFDLTAMADGGDGLREVVQWWALAPHLEAPVQVDEAEAALLGRVSPGRWRDVATLAEPDRGHVTRLIDVGLLVDEGAPGEPGSRDEAQRQAHWYPAAALLHRQSRWSGEDSAAAMEARRLFTARDLREQLGPPAPEIVERGHGDPIALPQGPAAQAIAGNRRVTCRNFDTQRSLSPAQLSALLAATVMAHARVEAEPGVAFLKKAVPSGGALHAAESYLLVQRVDGIDPGLYHYRPLEHALVAMPCPPMEGLAKRLLAGQHWFADAPVHLLLTVRYARAFWKYRNHPKAYRAALLDLGHISQAMFTAAGEQGLGAYVTAAINEVDIEQALGLEPLAEGPLLACGAGWRGAAQVTPELDPLAVVWPG